MLTAMTLPLLSPLEFLAPLDVSGPDARTFLQGQVSSDLQRLEAGICQLASLNSPQGRVEAVLTLVPRPAGVLLLVPATMLETVSARLRKYVLRSKVMLADLRATQALYVATREQLALAGLPCPGQPGICLEHEGSVVIRWHEPGAGLPERFLVVAAQGGRHGEPADAAWRRAEIRAGLPQVWPATHQAFVAQMLNLDLVGGIAFDKGCYTGQEIIARTQYRGAIKRRMFRFAAACPAPLPGTRIVAGEAHAGDVVEAVDTAAGCELLAVVSLAQKSAALELATSPAVTLERLPLPYPVAEE